MADRPHRPRAAAVAVTGTGQRRLRPVQWGQRAGTVRTLVQAATAADQPHPVRSWICGSRSCGLSRAATADIHAGPLQATVARAEHPATADPATGEAAPRVAADTIQRPVAVDIPPVAVAGTPVAAVVDTPAVAVAIRVVAAIPAAEDMAEAIAKKLGDGMSPREAAT